MSNDDTSFDGKSRVTPLTTSSNAPVVRSKPQSWFALPAPVKRVFDVFPLREYESNALPARAPGPKQREENVLHVFIREEDVRAGRPSFNPGCLKWQVRNRVSCLKIRAHWKWSGLMVKLGLTIELLYKTDIPPFQRRTFLSSVLEQPRFSFGIVTLPSTCEREQQHHSNDTRSHTCE